MIPTFAPVTTSSLSYLTKLISPSTTISTFACLTNTDFGILFVFKQDLQLYFQANISSFANTAEWSNMECAWRGWWYYLEQCTHTTAHGTVLCSLQRPAPLLCQRSIRLHYGYKRGQDACRKVVLYRYSFAVYIFFVISDAFSTSSSSRFAINIHLSRSILSTASTSISAVLAVARSSL